MRRLLLLLATASLALAVVEETRKLDPFVSVSICAPLSVLVKEGPSFAARLAAADRAVLDAVSLTQTRRAVAIELVKEVKTDAPIVVELTVAPRSIQYLERVVAPGDTAVLTSFDADKCEVASSGDGNWWLPRVGGVSLAKASMGGNGTLFLKATTPFVELFAAAHAADARVEGANGTVSVRLDDGRGLIVPATPDAAIGGYVLNGRLAYTQGTCTVRDEGGGKGSACSRVGAPPAVRPSLKWACGIETKGEWACGGGGKGGAPSVRATECRAGKEVEMGVES